MEPTDGPVAGGEGSADRPPRSYTCCYDGAPFLQDSDTSTTRAPTGYPSIHEAFPLGFPGVEHPCLDTTVKIILYIAYYIYVYYIGSMYSIRVGLGSVMPSKPEAALLT